MRQATRHPDRMPQPAVDIDRADMEVAGGIGRTRDKWGRSDTWVRSHELRLRLNVAEGEGPRAIRLPDRMPQPPVDVDRADMEVAGGAGVGAAGEVGRTRDKWSWSDTWVRSHEAGLRLNVAEGEGPRAIRHPNCVPQPTVVVDDADVQIPSFVGRARHPRRGT